jgi:hypothetical protein
MFYQNPLTIAHFLLLPVLPLLKLYLSCVNFVFEFLLATVQDIAAWAALDSFGGSANVGANAAKAAATAATHAVHSAANQMAQDAASRWSWLTWNAAASKVVTDYTAEATTVLGFDDDVYI